MVDFTEIVPVEDILKEGGLATKGNFEDLYSSAFTKPSTRAALEKAVYEYFASLQLPDETTLYDLLILSLRPKDVIATFNWDPFLIQAALRNRQLSDVPKLLFLHGNVAHGFCERDAVHGPLGARCSKCGVSFRSVNLLYPIKDKRYSSDPAINSAWEHLKWAFGNAFMVTVFGYGAPSSDVAAVELLRIAWRGWQERNLEQFEFIDIRDEESLVRSWKGFIHPGQHHYEIHTNFFDSWVARHPRRTGEAWWKQYLEAMFIDDNPLPRSNALREVQDWYKPLIAAENSRT